jgi:hypothetical protein
MEQWTGPGGQQIAREVNVRWSGNLGRAKGAFYKAVL